MSKPKWTNSCATNSNVPAAAKAVEINLMGDLEFFRETEAQAACLGAVMSANKLPENQKKVKGTKKL